ncbi:MAG: phosphatase PAP2 family protein [Pyrinomonadaceae bacterium]
MNQPFQPTEERETKRRTLFRRIAARRLWRAETRYLTALSAFGVLAVLARLNTYFWWDVTAARWLQNLSVPGLLEFMRLASVAGNNWKPWALTCATALAFLVFRHRSEAAALAFSAGGGALVNNLLKLAIARPRPTAELVEIFRAARGLSFPSGHVTFYVCYFGFLFFVAYAILPKGSLARRAALTLSALPVVVIGFSRVYLGAHWPSDTLGAYLSSGLWLGLSLHLYRRWKERKLNDECEKMNDE